jgi:hypothetical protein
MNTLRSNPQFVKNMGGRTQPSGSGFGYLLVAVMAIFLIGTNTYGFAQATGLPPLIGLTVATLAFVIRMYMIRRRSPYERVTSDGLERTLFYLPAAILSTGLSAFAIYSLVVDSDANPKRRPAGEKPAHAIDMLENYYHDVRAKIRSRLKNINERLDGLNNQPPSEQIQTEIGDLNEEQVTLRRLFQQTTIALNSLASALTDGGNSVQEELNRRYDEAARLHRELLDDISHDVEPPMLESLPEDTTSGGKLQRFFRSVMALTNEAIGCIAVPIILEIFIVILVVSNRPRE